MYKIVLGGKERKVKFGLRAIVETGIIDKISKFSEQARDKASLSTVVEIGEIIAESLLAGLQKDPDYKIDFEDNDEHRAKLFDVMDQVDDWADEEGNDVMTLFEELQTELSEKGFLGNVSRSLMETEENLTEIPQDHKKKTKK